MHQRALRPVREDRMSSRKVVPPARLSLTAEGRR